MSLSIDLVLYIIAAILMGLAGFSVPAGRANWMCLSFMVLIISLIV
jgi:hypothetical protein